MCKGKNLQIDTLIQKQKLMVMQKKIFEQLEMGKLTTVSYFFIPTRCDFKQPDPSNKYEFLSQAHCFSDAELNEKRST